MMKSTLRHVTSDSLSQLYRYDAASHTTAGKSQRYSTVTYGTESERVNHFVERYCTYFRDYYSVRALPSSMHPRAVKLGVDRHIQNHVSQTSLDDSLCRVITNTVPDIETIAFWLEAGTIPSEQTLIRAVKQQLPLKTLQLMLEHAKCSSEVVIAAMNSKWALLRNRFCKDIYLKF